METRIKNDYKTTHNMSRTKLYKKWQGIKDRCKNNKHKYYGKKGIVVCTKWQTFEPFMKWALNNGYDNNLTIDRKDTNGNYEPTNCRFVNRSIQQQNRNKIKNTKNKYIGVTETPYGKFRVSIFESGKYIFRKTFNLEKDAVEARNQFIIENNLKHTIQTF